MVELNEGTSEGAPGFLLTKPLIYFALVFDTHPFYAYHRLANASMGHMYFLAVYYAIQGEKLFACLLKGIRDTSSNHFVSFQGGEYTYNLRNLYWLDKLQGPRSAALTKTYENIVESLGYYCKDDGSSVNNRTRAVVARHYHPTLVKRLCPPTVNDLAAEHRKLYEELMKLSDRPYEAKDPEQFKHLYTARA